MEYAPIVKVSTCTSLVARIPLVCDIVLTTHTPDDSIQLSFIIELEMCNLL